MKISIIGLGYVGLPLAIEFSKTYSTVGFDINENRVQQLNTSIDINGDIVESSLVTTEARFSSSTSDIKDSNIYIITVPTPIDKKNNPDLSLLKNACDTVGSVLNNNNIVIFESTVYPGTTEEICVPILEKNSKLDYITEGNKNSVNDGFYCGYSPERINPGDQEQHKKLLRKLTTYIKQ